MNIRGRDLSASELLQLAFPDFPNEHPLSRMIDPIIITDDAEAQATLIRAGQPLPKPTPPFTKSICYFRHEVGGHLFYWMASFECGHERPCDNGYVLIGLPASQFTAAEAADHFIATVAATSHGVITTEAFPDFTRN